MPKQPKQSTPPAGEKAPRRRRTKRANNPIPAALARFERTVSQQRHERDMKAVQHQAVVQEDPSKIMGEREYQAYLRGTKKHGMSPAKLARLFVPNWRA